MKPKLFELSLVPAVAPILLCFLLLTVFLSGCTPTGRGSQESLAPPEGKNTLRVGVSTNAPPHAYRAKGELQGLEIDLALQLGAFLQREVEFVELEWSKQLSALEEEKIDIIMSGMTVTSKRAYRVAFSKPYMRTGQIFLVRMAQANRFSSGIYSLMGNKPAIGVIKDTTGDFFITKTINRANLTRFKKSEQAVEALLEGKIDVFVHDAPIVCHFAARNEQEKLTPIVKFATKEYLAWPVNRNNKKLLEKVNSFISAKSEDGSLQKSITYWVPLLK